jgi:FKBP-type peptidyl-prolyl cis-trans isomerase FklB
LASRAIDISGAILAALLTGALGASVAHGEPLSDPTERLSYSLGHQIGTDLVRQERSVDDEALAKGLRDALAGQSPELAPEEMEALLTDLKRGIVAEESRDRLRTESSLRQAGADFLSANAQQEGVVVLASGLQYRVIRAGSGRHPRAEDRVELRYRSTRVDGTPFHDSTQADTPPDTHGVDTLIPGLEEALLLMPEGSRWRVFIPPGLAFGRRGPLADHTVIYDLDLIAVLPHVAEEQRAGETAGEGEER